MLNTIRAKFFLILLPLGLISILFIISFLQPYGQFRAQQRIYRAEQVESLALSRLEFLLILEKVALAGNVFLDRFVDDQWNTERAEISGLIQRVQEGEQKLEQLFLPAHFYEDRAALREIIRRILAAQDNDLENEARQLFVNRYMPISTRLLEQLHIASLSLQDRVRVENRRLSKLVGSLHWFISDEMDEELEDIFLDYSQTMQAWELVHAQSKLMSAYQELAYSDEKAAKTKVRGGIETITDLITVWRIRLAQERELGDEQEEYEAESAAIQRLEKGFGRLAAIEPIALKIIDETPAASRAAALAPYFQWREKRHNQPLLAIISDNEEELAGDLAELEEETLAIGLQLALLAFLVFAALVLTPWLFTRVLVRPIHQLAAAAGQLGRGLLSARANLGRRDEVGKLAFAFDEMADNVERLAGNLERQRELLEVTLGSIGDGIVVTDAKGRITFLNEVAEGLIGVSQEACLNREADDVFRIVDKTAADETGGDHLPGHAVLARPDGERLPVDRNQAPIRLADGSVMGQVLVFRDISARVQAERSLVEAKNRAEFADRAKTEFLAMVSHEVRTPMNGVLGMMGLLIDSGLNHDQREMAEVAHHSAESLVTVINDILDFSKIESGTVDVALAPFDLRQCLEDVVELYLPKARSKGLSLAVAMEPDLPAMVKGDQGRLRQILNNLIINALKFTERGHVLLTAKLDLQTDAIAHVRFTVADTGIGFDQSNRELLFKPFSQLDGSSTRRYGGVGLGLAICRQLASAMGGVIDVISEPGKGASFFFVLPLRLLQLPGAGERRWPQAPINANVLLVSESLLWRRVYEKQLRCIGCETTVIPRIADLEPAVRDSEEPPVFSAVLLDRGSMAEPGELEPLFSVLDKNKTGWLLAVDEDDGEPDKRPFGEGLVQVLAKPARLQQLHDSLLQVLGFRRAVASSPVKIEAADLFAGRDLRVLVVEDNIVNQKVTARMLKKLGLQVDLADNGCEAVQHFAKARYDLVLMDCQMPEMDGFEATRQIREREGEQARTPIVALTANALKSSQESCFAAGMDGFLTKPVKMDRLSSVLQEHLPA